MEELEKELDETNKNKKLTARQERFCQEYVLCLNKTLAYKRAFGCENYDSAKTLGCKLFTNVYIRNRVEELKAEIVEQYQLSREQVIHMAMNVYGMAQEGSPEMKLNREGKFVPTGNKVYDYKAMNDAVRNITTLCGFNTSEVKAEIKANVESEVNVITAKDIVTELIKK